MVIVDDGMDEYHSKRLTTYPAFCPFNLHAPLSHFSSNPSETVSRLLYGTIQPVPLFG